MPDVLVREVGLRDGLQMLAAVMPTHEKAAWCTAEYAAGVREIEVCSFVPSRLMPQFADAEAVVAHALGHPDLTVTVLVPNVRGAERAIASGAGKLVVPISVSDAHNRANLRRSVDQSVAELHRIVERAHAAGRTLRPKVAAVLGTSFGCSIAGAVPEKDVRRLAEQVAAAGVDEVVLADTVGYGDPASVRRLFGAVSGDLGMLPMAAHFHDTRGLALANAFAALDAGIRAFDGSLGGLGGCPHAPGATGNVATEDLVFMIEACGLSTGIDLTALLNVRDHIRQALPDAPFAGAISRAGLPKGWPRHAGGRPGEVEDGAHHDHTSKTITLEGGRACRD